MLGWEKLPAPYRHSLSPATQKALSQYPSDWPEIEYIVLDAYRGRTLEDVPPDGQNYVSPNAALVAPLSRGNVTIASSDTNDSPIIDPAWLTHPGDQELAIASFKRLRQAMDTIDVRSVTIGQELTPGRNVSSDKEILEHIRQTAFQVYHAAGTCE